jgi:hypothetical protein
MAKRGRYYELFSTQAKRYVTEGEAVLESVPEEIRPQRGAPDHMPPAPGAPMGAGRRRHS